MWNYLLIHSEDHQSRGVIMIGY